MTNFEAVLTSRRHLEESFVGKTVASCEEAGGMGMGMGLERAGGVEETGGVEEAGALVRRSGVGGVKEEGSEASESDLGLSILDLSLGPWPPALTLIFRHLSYTNRVNNYNEQALNNNNNNKQSVCMSIYLVCQT